MHTLTEKDERVRLSIFIILAFIIQGFIFYGISINMLSKINDRYIAQNTSIIGKISTYDKGLSQEIIPIITGKEGNIKDYYNEGKNILNKYSYNEDLKYSFNPLFENIGEAWKVAIIIFSLVSLFIVLIGVIFIINPVFKEIKYLTVRAENIVENKFEVQNKKYRYRGSLDKFINKFNLMEDRIKNSIQLLKDEKVNLKNIINDISHQLKTPLMALSMCNDILKEHREMDEDDIDNFINLSKEQLERMDWLVKTLLKYARLESNAVEYKKEYISLNNTVEESINPLIIKAEQKNQTLNFSSNKIINYFHDRNWIAEAVSNIIKNAIEHTQEGGTVEVTLNDTPLSITIAIKDNGEGIEKSELKKIFNRFYKGENSINPTSIGIGLCLSKSIIRSHDGDITVESEVGVGSTFYITFLKTAVLV